MHQPLPAADLERWTKPLRGRFNSQEYFMASLLALLIPLQVQCADSHRDELNTNYTSAEVVSIMWQVSFLPAKPIMKET